MGWPSICIQERGRRRLAKMSALFCILGILLCIVVLATGIYIYMNIKTKIHLIEQYNAKSLPIFMMIVGFVGILFNIIGIKVCWTNSYPEKRAKWVSFLLVYVVGCVLLFLCVIISSFVCFGAIPMLEDGFSAGIYSGMKKYSSDMNKKSEIDMLQFEYRCCGSRAYTDWFHVNWIHEDYLGQAKKKFIYDTKQPYLNDDAPYSCCDPNKTRPCIHHHIHDNDLHFNYDFKTELTLYKTGCTTALMSFFGDVVLKDVGIVVLCISFIELILVIMTRFLQTSIAQAVANGDPEGEAIGFLLPFGGKKGEEKKDEKEPLLKAEGEESEDKKSLELPVAGTTDDEFFDDSSFTNEFDLPPVGVNETTPVPLVNNVLPNENIYENVPLAEPIYENAIQGNMDQVNVLQGQTDHLVENVSPPEHLPEYIPQQENLPEFIPHPENLPEYIPQPQTLPENIPQPGHLTEDIPQSENLPEYVPQPENLHNDASQTRQVLGNDSLNNLPPAPPIPDYEITIN